MALRSTSSEARQISKRVEMGSPSAAVSSEDLAIINQFALDPLTADECFVQTMDLATSWYDRDFQRFPLDVMVDFRKTLPGKSVLLGHRYDSVAEGLWFKAELVEVPAPTHESAPSPGPHMVLRASWYTPKTAANEHLRQLVRSGVIRYCSITIKGEDLTCDLCGRSMFEWECPHRLGGQYEGQTATGTWVGPAEAYEGSLVYLGAQYGAEARKDAARRAACAAALLSGAKGGLDMQPEEQPRLVAALERLYELVDQKLPAGVAEGQSFREIDWQNGEPDVLQEMIWERVMERYPQQLANEARTALRWFAKEGRVLSSANRELISSAAAALSECSAMLQDLLDATDPSRAAAAAMEDQLRAALGIAPGEDPVQALRYYAALRQATA